jgi:hypothetical protein
MARLHKEIQRFDLFGFRTAEVAEKAAQLDALLEEMDRKISELEDLGVEVKDLDFGWVDFPAEKYGERVMLCWRYGEPGVAFWHRHDEGYYDRKPLKLQLISP